MKFVRYDGDRLGLLAGNGGIVDLTERLDLGSDDPLLEFVRTGRDAGRYAGCDADVGVDDVTVESPVRSPGKILAAPGNYADHQAEMSGGELTVPRSYFLKAPSSVCGPADTVELPFSDRRFDHEIELAFVVGEKLKDADPGEVLDAVFGYTVVLDISMRGEEDRSNRKSYDTFTVVGPCVATPDEVGDPQELAMELRLNGEVRQDATTADMIVPCGEFGSLASVGTTLRAGDVVTTGTPSGVSQLSEGDVIHAEIENLGAMTVAVEERDRRHADLEVGTTLQR